MNWQRWLVASAIGLPVSVACLAITPIGSGLAMASVSLPRTVRGDEMAIVLLGGHMSRLPAAIELQRKTRLPLLMSGARSEDYLPPLRSAGTVLVEDRSFTTEQNAAYSSCILAARGIRSVFLITAGHHTRRAAGWFRYYGIEVSPVPVQQPGLTGAARYRIALHDAEAAAHEWLGLIDLWAAMLTKRRIPCVK